MVDFRHGNLHRQDTSQNFRMAQRQCGIVEDKNKQANQHLKMKVLRQGQLFGEISLIYKCMTTASVIALKYCTIGKLKSDDFTEITLQHPEILKYVKEYIFEYADKDMRFIKSALKQMPFFSHLQDKDSILYEIIYSLQPMKKNAQEKLIEQGDEINDIYIIERGIVEIFVKIGGNDIVLERLFRGSVINYKNIFTRDKSQVNMRFATEGVVTSLNRERLNQLKKNDKKLAKRMSKFELKVTKIPSAPLDYILVLPKKVNAKLIERTREKMLFGRQEALMEELTKRKQFHKKTKGLEMDDIEIARTLTDLKKEMLHDIEVIHHLTKMNHLEIRVKNVAVLKLLRQQSKAETDNLKNSLMKLIKNVSKKASSGNNKLLRMNTSQLAADGLMSRLSEKIQDTQRKINMQENSLRRIQRNVEVLTPVGQRKPY